LVTGASPIIAFRTMLDLVIEATQALW